MNQPFSHPQSRTIPPPPGQPTSPHTVKKTLTPTQRTRRVVENNDYAAFTRRVLRAHARRIATGDVEGLTALLAMEQELADAIHTAVQGLRAQGYSWTEIATRLGISRQAAHQRWNRPS